MPFVRKNKKSQKKGNSPFKKKKKKQGNCAGAGNQERGGTKTILRKHPAVIRGKKNTSGGCLSVPTWVTRLDPSEIREREV